MPVSGCVVLLQPYGDLTTEVGMEDVASYGVGMGLAKAAYFLDISRGKGLPAHHLHIHAINVTLVGKCSNAAPEFDVIRASSHRVLLKTAQAVPICNLDLHSSNGFKFVA